MSRLPALVTMPDIARMTGEKPNTIRVWVTRGKLPAPAARLTTGPIWLYDDIVEWIAAQAAPVNTSPQVLPRETPARG